MGSYFSHHETFHQKFHREMSTIANQTDDIYNFNDIHGRVLVTKYDDICTIVIVYRGKVVTKNVSNHEFLPVVRECLDNINAEQ